MDEFNPHALTRELTFGEKAVGVTFNPSSNPMVDAIKEKSAELIDLMHTLREATGNPEVKRQLSTAMTNAQTAQMWAVKAVTWQY